MESENNMNLYGFAKNYVKIKVVDKERPFNEIELKMINDMDQMIGSVN